MKVAFALHVRHCVFTFGIMVKSLAGIGWELCRKRWEEMLRMYTYLHVCTCIVYMYILYTSLYQFPPESQGGYPPEMHAVSRKVRVPGIAHTIVRLCFDFLSYDFSVSNICLTLVF